MKLFNAIATAAVIGGSVLIPNPAEARNGWVTAGSYTGTNGQSVYVYVKPVDRSGSVRSFQNWNTESEREFTAKAMCDT